MAKKVSITPPVRHELIALRNSGCSQAMEKNCEGSSGLDKKNSNYLLYETSNFIKKYPEHIQEIIINFSHVLFIPENLVIKEIIFLQDILREYNIKNLLIILEKNSHARILFFQEDSCEKIIDSSISSGRTGDINFNLQESSRLEFFTCLTGVGACGTEFNLSVNLLGEHAHANVTGFYIAGKNQKIKMQTSQKHLSQNSFSNLIINGLLAQESQVKYCGKIFVAKDATGVKASQENKNILFGENIFLDAAPELEVLNDEVECKHGCAAGKFDDKQLFYLQSRGLNKNQATLLLIEGFFGFINNLDYDIRSRESLLEKIKLKIRGIL